MLKRVIDYAHDLLKQTISQNDHVVDGTAGNGHDTLKLSQLVGGQGRVYAFDIQQQAIEATKDRLQTHHINNVTLIKDSHANLENYIPEEKHGLIGGAIFNLGYLPGSDKSIITEGKSTIMAIEKLCSYLKPGRLIILVVYHGHTGGKVEKNALLSYLKTLDQKQFNVARYGFINQKNDPPFIIAIEKK